VVMEGATFAVRVQAGARREEILGMRDGALVARVGAPARDGRANRALCALIARHLGVRRSQVAIVRGERSRDKLVRVDGIDGASLRAALGPLD
jgi:uncharacterized protein (TIGR00251 family)